MTRALLINPAIHDFAAYDFWAKPLGLQLVAALLKANGVTVDWLDLADPLSPHLPDSLRPVRKPGGHGKFPKENLPRPALLPNINRRFGRYGLPLEITRRALAAQPRPDAILVTSMMTYWRLGVFEAIALAREQWPGVPVVLGGVYATLCEDHAKQHSGADRICPGPVFQSVPILSEVLGVHLQAVDPKTLIPARLPAPCSDNAALLTSFGCPLACGYCGVKTLQPRFVRLSIERVEAEVNHIATVLKIRDIALYDDAFLLDGRRALEILDRVARLPVSIRFHAASGLSCRGVTPTIALAMKGAGFSTIRLGLETTNPQDQQALGGKVTTDEFRQAVENLRSAGFAPGEMGAYVLCALPGQTFEEIEQTVEEVFRAGIRPHLAEYSPVPGSPMFPEAAARSVFDLSEPLFQNPTLLPCRSTEITVEKMLKLKSRIGDRVRSLYNQSKYSIFI